MKEFIAFELLKNEVDFLKKQILLFHKKFPFVPILFVFQDNLSKKNILIEYSELNGIATFCTRGNLVKYHFPNVRLFITSEQYSNGIKHIHSLCSFHGQPSKGLTLRHGSNKYFNGFLTLGKFQKKIIQEYYHFYKNNSMPTLYDVGYPKSDEVLNSDIDKNQFLKSIGLSYDKKLILYAPAFNEYASMREYGLEIIETLLQTNKWNVVVKLAVDCWDSKDSLYANGGINWFEFFNKKFKSNSNFYLYKHRDINPLLVVSDLLITCVSSVSFEFLVQGKPVIFIDTPKFYSHYLKKFFPHDNTFEWKDKLSVNAGREFGVVINNIKNELCDEVEIALRNKFCNNSKRSIQNKFLFNPGRATLTTVNLFYSLYKKNKIPLILQIKSYLYSLSVKYYRNNILHKFVKCFSLSLYSCQVSKHSKRATYIHCANTVNSAIKAKMSINDYLESVEDHPSKKGHRDRILKQLYKIGVLDVENKIILEIGAGTGRFLEKVIEYKPKTYVIYETDEYWSDYLRKVFSCLASTKLFVNESDGFTLNKTVNSSIDFVYAHAVFVYLPIVTVVGYLKEISRVCKTGGLVCFDLFYDTDTSLNMIETYELAKIRWPVVISRALIEKIYVDLGFSVVNEFTEIYASTFSRYIILKKCRDNNPVS